MRRIILSVGASFGLYCCVSSFVVNKETVLHKNESPICISDSSRTNELEQTVEELTSQKNRAQKTARFCENDLKNLRRQKELERSLQERVGERTISAVEELLSNYPLSVTTEFNRFPIKLNGDLYKYVLRFNQIKNEEKRAKAIFDWQIKTVKYGVSRRLKRKYRDSIDAYNQKEAVCGEAAYLYMAIARATGLKTKYVNVLVDAAGKPVKHACVALFIEDKRILIDPAYNAFNVHHKKIEVIDDFRVYKLFTAWNKRSK